MPKRPVRYEKQKKARERALKERRPSAMRMYLWNITIKKKSS